MSRDIASQCIENVSRIIERAMSCIDCFEVYVDYNVLRHPYTTIFMMLLKCDKQPGDCEENLYGIVMEVVLNIDVLSKNILDIEKDVIIIRIKCGDGWLEYGYGVQKSSQSIAHLSKSFSILYGGRRYSMESIDKNLIERLSSYLTFLTRKVREIIEGEGVI